VRVTPGQRGARGARAVVTLACAALVVVQLVWLLQWSWHLLDSADVTWDYSIYYQPWYLIAHGQLLPRNTLQGGYLFIRNDGELIVYLLAPLYWLFPNHQLGYLWLQDLAIAGVSATCLRLVVEQVPWRTTAALRDQLVAAGARALAAVLLVANPFVYWTASFDIHMEVFGAFFATLLLRAALQRRRSAAVWAVLTALCGAASLLDVIGVGLAVAVVELWRSRAALRRGGQRREGLRAVIRPLGLSAFAVAWLVVLGALHATVGSPSYDYTYLSGTGVFSTPSFPQIALGIVRHLRTAYDVVASHGWNLWANTSPDGFAGLLSPALLVVALPLLANNLIRGEAFSYPSFQNYVAYGFVALGSVAWVVVLMRRRHLWLLGAALAGLMVWNAVGWFGAWSAGVADEYMVPAPVATLVKQVAHEAAAGDEVVTSNGFGGLFAGRSQIFVLINSAVIPIRSHTVWFVLSTNPGIDTQSGTQSDEAIGTIEELPGVETLDDDVDGTYVWRWHPPAGVRSLALATTESHYPVWMDPGPDVVAITSTPPSGWSVSTDGKTSYLVVGDFFQLEPGRYVATVRIQADGPVTPEVWDDAGPGPERILAGKVVRPRRARDVRLPFAVPGNPADYNHPGAEAPAGSGLFRLLGNQGSPLPPTIEIRVWVPPGAIARAWWVSITPAG
jgi:uncharacterized membrane protein